MSFQLYESRILSLENDYLNTRREIGDLLRLLKHKPETVDPGAVRSQLNLLSKFIQLIKKQRAFYLELGENYDLMRLHEEFIQVLLERDPELAVSIIREIDSRWTIQRKSDCQDDSDDDM